MITHPSCMFSPQRFVFAISRSLPLFMVISWIYSVAMIIKGIVYEKEMRLKEVMKIMGLGNGVHWVAWFINAFVLMFITVFLFCIVLKASGCSFWYGHSSGEECMDLLCVLFITCFVNLFILAFWVSFCGRKIFISARFMRNIFFWHGSMCVCVHMHMFKYAYICMFISISVYACDDSTSYHWSLSFILWCISV